MIKGTTPTITFKLNTELDLSALEQIWVTVKNGFYERTWDKDDLVVDNTNKKISLTLSQEDTLKLPNDFVDTQIRLLDASDKAYATAIKTISVGAILKEGVIE